ncbi:MAG: LCP family protein [Leptolyngbya sp. BL-A-14]
MSSRDKGYEPTGRRDFKQPQKRRRRRLIRQLLFLGLLGLLSGTSGAALALLASTPLKHRHAHALPNRSDRLSTLLPATLGRPINILVLGIDNSGHPHAGATLPPEALAGNSDTMLLVRLIPETQQVNILSIPRDTLVETPAGIDKINDANMQGGVTQAAQTVSHLLNGMPIDRYIRLDTEGFIHLVDALGGVEINVPKPMDYTDHTQHLAIRLAAGVQTLNGQHLQEYVRFRHDEWGDIGRVQRQQEVLKAIVHTLMQPATLGKLPQLLQVVRSNVDTDLSVSELLAIAQLTHGIDAHRLNLVMLPGRFSRKQEYPLSYWIEDPHATTAILSRYFGGATVATSETATDSLRPDQIQIAVANATDRPELATRVVALLKARGFSNVYLTEHEIDTNPETMVSTQIIAQQGNPATASLVQQAIGLGQVQVASTGDLASDVTIVIEPDVANKLSQP